MPSESEALAMRKDMSYEEKTLYKERKAIQWCKEGLACELADVAEKLMLADTREEMLNLLDALKMDIETVIDAIETLERSKKYFAEREEEQ